MAKKRYTSPQIIESVKADPREQPIAIYIRQSTGGQVGNESTAMQEDEFPAWIRDVKGWQNIILINDDLGVSGTLPIDERSGMRRLLNMITNCEIAAVGCVAEDRLFRDQTMIQPNVFLDECCKAGVLVITPEMTYDFNGPDRKYHREKFRSKCRAAADHRERYVDELLTPAKRNKALRGEWVGASIPPGFMVKYATVPNARNKYGRPVEEARFTPFEPFISVICEYFRLLVHYRGNVRATATHIRLSGPYYPDWDSPEIRAKISADCVLYKPKSFKRQLAGNGKQEYFPRCAVLYGMFTNVVYIGHWRVGDQVVRYNNHPGIVPEKLFWQAFNYVSEVTLDGGPNEHYTPFLRRKRLTTEKPADMPAPLCDRVLVCRDENGVGHGAQIVWVKTNTYQIYRIIGGKPEYRTLWHRRADHVDSVVLEALRGRAAFSASAHVLPWALADFAQNAFNATQSPAQDFAAERKILARLVEDIERQKKTLANNLERIDDPELVAETQRRYGERKREIERLQAKIAELDVAESKQEEFKRFSDNLYWYFQNIDDLSHKDRQTLIDCCVKSVEVERDSHDKRDLKLTIVWRDNYPPTVITLARTGKNGWTSVELSLLQELAARNADQIEIAATFPDRTWRAIRRTHLRHFGLLLDFEREPIAEGQTYAQFMADGEPTESNFSYPSSV